MKKFSIAFIVVMLFCFAPVLVYAGPLDAETAEQELGLSVTSGIDMSKKHNLPLMMQNHRRCGKSRNCHRNQC